MRQAAPLSKLITPNGWDRSGNNAIRLLLPNGNVLPVGSTAHRILPVHAQITDILNFRLTVLSFSLGQLIVQIEIFQEIPFLYRIINHRVRRCGGDFCLRI